jgi:hypothetical protein
MWNTLYWIVFIVMVWWLLENPAITINGSLGHVMLFACIITFVIIALIRLLFALLLYPFRPR